MKIISIKNEFLGCIGKREDLNKRIRRNEKNLIFLKRL